ncbi:hypothetical protein ACQPUY_15590 [Clostridium nigeriense]|uniref:hypothetical protein n=1 Tax=Clostridium nigeriense TaxID=1805470 RepID=UPI003D327DCE
MKRKCFLSATLIAIFTTFSSIATYAHTNYIEQKFDVKADEIDKEIKVENEGKTYLLKLQNIVSENEVVASKKDYIEEVKEVIVDTNNATDILTKYPVIEFTDNSGNVSTLNATEIISVEVAGEDESYWETLETISKTLTLTAAQVNAMGEDVTKLVENNKTYELTNAEFTPIEFENNEPTLYSAKVEYTTVIPHHEKIVNSYKAKIKYVGEIEKKNVIGYETIANYSVEEIQNSNLPAILGTTAGIGVFVVIGWIFINNVTLFSGNKKLRSYRKNKNIIEIDITKEYDLYENLNLLIKKRLAKRLDNTLLVIKANGKEIHRTVLNSVNEDMKIIIN